MSVSTASSVWAAWTVWAAVTGAGPALTLERAIELAAERHQTTAIARAQVERAEAVRKMAVSALLPEVALSGTYTRQPERRAEFGPGQSILVQEAENASARASVNVTLLEAKNFVVLQRARPAFEAVEARAAELRRRLGFEVARAFLEVLRAEQVAAAAEHRVSVAEKASEDAQRRFEQGMAGKNDVTRAELELQTAQLTVADSIATIRDLRVALGRYAGEEADNPLSPPDILFVAPETKPEDLIRLAHDNRPDLAALRADAEAARIAAKEPLWGLVPNLSLDGAYDLTTQEGFTGSNSNWSLAFSARWVLYDRGLRYRQTEEREAQAREAELILERELENSSVGVRRALVQIERAKVVLSRAETREALARQNAQEIAVRYREGVTTAFELANAGAQEFEASAELSKARLDLGVSVLSLREATGAGALTDSR